MHTHRESNKMKPPGGKLHFTNYTGPLILDMIQIYKHTTL